MNPFEFALAVVIVVMIAKVFQARFRSGRDWHGRPLDAADTAETLRLREEVRALRDRVQVLERVITDNHTSSSLDREIEKLRNETRV